MLRVRPSQPEDRPALRALLTEEQTAERSVDALMQAPTERVMDAYFSEMLGWIAELDGMIFVAESDGGLIGFVAVLIEIKHESWTTMVRRGYISNLVVSESQRGQGIGQRLLTEAETYARAKGCDHLLLDVLANNAPALKAYERFGFSPREIQMHKPLD